MLTDINAAVGDHATPWSAEFPDHGFDAPPPPDVIEQGQGSKQDNVVYVTEADGGSNSSTTTTTPEHNNHVVAAEPWLACMDDKTRACYSIEDMVLLSDLVFPTLLTDSEGSFPNIVHNINAVVDDHATPWPADLPDHCLEAPPPPPSEILIGQGSISTASNQENDAHSCTTTLATPWLVASPYDQSFHAPPQVVHHQDQFSKENDGLFVSTDAGNSSCTTTTNPKNNHVAALEPWRAWLDNKLRACQSIEDMVLLKQCFSHLKDSVDSSIVASYFN